MGIGPWNMQVHNETLVLFASNVPFIMRGKKKRGSFSEENQRHTKMSDCYLHGIMKGQAVTGLDSQRKLGSLY